MHYTYKKAGLKDIDTLVRTRIEVLRAANRLGDDIDMSLVEKNSRQYYEKALRSDMHRAYLAGSYRYGAAPV